MTHIGVDAESGLTHSLETTPATVSDVAVAHALRHGGEEQVWGDAGYQGVGKREENRDAVVEWQVAMKPGQRRKLEKTGPEEAAEKRKAEVRAKVEHPFLYVKRHFGYAKVRYRGCGRTHSASPCCSGSPICSSQGATLEVLGRGVSTPPPLQGRAIHPGFRHETAPAEP